MEAELFKEFGLSIGLILILIGVVRYLYMQQQKSNEKREAFLERTVDYTTQTNRKLAENSEKLVDDMSIVLRSMDVVKSDVTTIKNDLEEIGQTVTKIDGRIDSLERTKGGNKK